MRKTTINVTPELDEKVRELTRLTNSNFIRVIEAAIYNYLKMIKSSGSYSPTYNTLDNIYVECEANEDGLDVFQDVEGGPYFYKLRKAHDFNELLNRPFFVEVTGDDLEFPRAIYDYEEKKPEDDDEIWKVFEMVDVTPANWKPKYFQRAGLVATPQLGLIGS